MPKNDGIFSENDELLTAFVSPNDGGIQTHVKPVDIPVSALTNQRLRMRVIFDSGATPPTACNLPGHPVVGSGEVEDYSVIVVDPSCHTLKDGFWTDPTIWSCGRVPHVMDVVHVNHEVTVPENYLAMAARLVYAQTVSGIRLSTGASIQLSH